VGGGGFGNVMVVEIDFKSMKYAAAGVRGETWSSTSSAK
jgi:hypothetical protein